MLRQLFALFVVLLAAAASAQETMPVPVGQRQLFLDDDCIQATVGLRKSMHQPVKKGAVILPDQPWDQDILETRSAPAWDEKEQKYKIWVLVHQDWPAYLESKDGIHWTKPILRQREFQGSLENNLLQEPSLPPYFLTPSVVLDPDDPDPNRRYKGLFFAAPVEPGWDGSRQPSVSPDGIHWKNLAVRNISAADETNLSYDRLTRTFIATMKTSGPHGRAHAIWISKDFAEWTNLKVLFHADEEDQRRAQLNIQARLADPQFRQPIYHNPADYNADIYNVGIFRYESLYVGLPAVYHATGLLPTRNNTDGFDIIQLACSRDLRTWQRVGDRQPFIGASQVGEDAYDQMQILPPSAPVIKGDELWFYYTGIKYRASPKTPEANHCAVCLAVLRRDGFVSLDADEKSGTTTTKPFQWSGSKLMANVETKERGELRAEILDTEGAVIATSQPLKGNQPRGEFGWSPALPKSLHGQPVSLRFTLREASFYSWWLE